MKKRRSKHYIEIFPAALLPQRKTWQTIDDSLPAGTWIVFLPKNKKRIHQVFLDLSRILEEKGRRVILWSPDTKADAANCSEQLCGCTWQRYRMVKDNKNAMTIEL